METFTEDLQLTQMQKINHEVPAPIDSSLICHHTRSKLRRISQKGTRNAVRFRDSECLELLDTTEELQRKAQQDDFLTQTYIMTPLIDMLTQTGEFPRGPTLWNRLKTNEMKSYRRSVVAGRESVSAREELLHGLFTFDWSTLDAYP